MKTLVQQAHICHVVASINENIGGPAYSVTNLAQALSGEGIDSHLFTLDYQNRGQQVPTSNVKIHSYPATQIAKFFRGFQPSASYALQQLASTELDLIHNHGLWMFPNLYARQAATKNNLPLLISPRGMLEAWSLKNSWFKKLPAWFLYEQQNLQKAIVFHGTSKEEVNSIRKLNFSQPIALIPNGVSLPDLSKQPNREILLQYFPELTDKKWLLFLSRIHPKKGLDNLMRTWSKIANEFSDWHLIIAGPDSSGYQKKLEILTKDLKLETSVTFTGMLSGKIKASALRNADLFVLPTHSENFGIAIAESLAYEVPVVTTKEAPWEDLVKYGCGWWIEDNQKSLEIALREGMQLSDIQRKEMGRKGRIMVEKKYSWSTIAQEMSRVYYWILHGGNPPTSVNFYKSI
ncbi:MAG: glycosyltransferase [Nostocaceae cyanobacterium]|nr:glycosyltransferase [Nostocaceae cyanobacterium]